MGKTANRQCRTTNRRWDDGGEQQIGDGELHIGNVTMEENRKLAMVENWRSKDSELENHRSAVENRRWRRILDQLLRDRESEWEPKIEREQVNWETKGELKTDWKLYMTVESSESGFGREDSPLDPSKSGWDGRDSPSTAR